MGPQLGRQRPTSSSTCSGGSCRSRPTPDPGAHVSFRSDPHVSLDTRETGTPLRCRPTSPCGPDPWRQLLHADLKPAVPNRSSVTAALVNIAAVNNRARQHVDLSSAPHRRRRVPPIKTSNVNVVPGQIKAALAVVPVVDGKIYDLQPLPERPTCSSTSSATSRRCPTTPPTGRIVPLDGTVPGVRHPRGRVRQSPARDRHGRGLELRRFAKSVSMPGRRPRSDAQSALIGNLTGTDLTRAVPERRPSSTYLTGLPGRCWAPPVSSNLNVRRGRSGAEHVADAATRPSGPTEPGQACTTTTVRCTTCSTCTPSSSAD